MSIDVRKGLQTAVNAELVSLEDVLKVVLTKGVLHLNDVCGNDLGHPVSGIKLVAVSELLHSPRYGPSQVSYCSLARHLRRLPAVAAERGARKDAVKWVWGVNFVANKAYIDPFVSYMTSHRRLLGAPAPTGVAALDSEVAAHVEDMTAKAAKAERLSEVRSALADRVGLQYTELVDPSAQPAVPEETDSRLWRSLRKQLLSTLGLKAAVNNVSMTSSNHRSREKFVNDLLALVADTPYMWVVSDDASPSGFPLLTCHERLPDDRVLARGPFVEVATSANWRLVAPGDVPVETVRLALSTQAETQLLPSVVEAMSVTSS